MQFTVPKIRTVFQDKSHGRIMEIEIRHVDCSFCTFFPLSAIVKPMLEDRAYRKACMSDYQNVETIDAIPRV